MVMIEMLSVHKHIKMEFLPKYIHTLYDIDDIIIDLIIISAAD